MTSEGHHTPSTSSVNAPMQEIAQAAKSIADDLRYFRTLCEDAAGSELLEVMLRRVALLASAAYAPDIKTDYSGMAGLLNFSTPEGAAQAAKAQNIPHVRVGKKRLQRLSDITIKHGKNHGP